MLNAYFRRIFAIVEDVLNVVEVTHGNPFQFAAPEFGVRVEYPPEDLGEEDTFTPNMAALLSQVMNITAANMPMGEMPELPPAMVNLSSTLLSRDTTGRRPRISAAVYGRDALFQERPSFISRNNRETERVGSIVIDISLRMNKSAVSISGPPNSNIVRPSFMKSLVSVLLLDVRIFKVLAYVDKLMKTFVVETSYMCQLLSCYAFT